MNRLLQTAHSDAALVSMVEALRNFLAQGVSPNAITDKQCVLPFCGAAEVSFELELTNCVLNDNNPHFINFYKWVQTSPDSFKDLRNRWKTDFVTWTHRRLDFHNLIQAGKTETKEAAQLTFYLSRTSKFFKFDATGTFGGAHQPDEEQDDRLPHIDWDAASHLMQNWVFSNHSDFRNLVVHEDAVIVVNAPQYAQAQWDNQVWEHAEHVALRDWLEGHSNRIIVFHTYRPRQEVDRLYRDRQPPWTGGDRMFHSLPL